MESTVSATARRLGASSEGLERWLSTISESNEISSDGAAVLGCKEGAGLVGARVEDNDGELEDATAVGVSE